MKRNKFNLSHDWQATYSMGPLYPNCFYEVLPGDNIQQVTESFSRFEAMIAPTMSRINKRQYFFYIPKRLIFGDSGQAWEKYITGGKDGNDSTVPPYITTPEGGFAVGSLADHLGVRPGIGGQKVSALPFRAYTKVMNDWFLNDQLDTFFDEETWTSGEDTTTPLDLVNKPWAKDRFTSALPHAQAGAQTYLPLGTSAPVAVAGTGKCLGFTSNSASTSTVEYFSIYNDSTHAVSFNKDLIGQSIGYNLVDPSTGNISSNLNNHGVGVVLDATKSGLTGTANLTSATAVTINQLRVAIAVQQFLERNNRSGCRLVEWTLAHFGIRIPDGRLQRSQYLGGYTEACQVMPVEQTSATGDDGTPQGNLAGRATSYGRKGFNFNVIEQGYILGLVCYMPVATYSQGMDPLWFRETRYDEYLPEFASVGDQEIKERELLFSEDSDQNVLTFGYTDRNDEYRRLPSVVRSQFRPEGSLHYWTLTRDFDETGGAYPQLNSSFIHALPSDRIFATQDGSDKIVAQFLHHIRARRLLPKFGNPGLKSV